MWYVYILQCRNGAFYTGITQDVQRRFSQHKQGKGARFTRSFGVKRILYQEPCFTKQEALKREAQMKKFSRQKKLDLIEGRSGF